MANQAKKSRFRWLRILGLLLVAFVGLLIVGSLAANEEVPTGNSGPEADAFAHKMLQAVNAEAWDSTGVVSWVFQDMHQHLWDRKRALVEVKWKENRVLLNLSTRQGIAYEQGQELESDQAQSLIVSAWEYWINDAFWLNPVVKVFDQGVSRSLVQTEDGREGLLVSFSSGGVTPGDQYLWFTDEAGLPTEWKIWVSVIPIGGIGFSWEGWQTLSTGAKVATTHDTGIGELTVSQVKASAQLSDWFSPEADPFFPLLSRGI